MNNSQEITVSDTAKVMAAVRAYESKREDALFIDPFAEKLAGQEVMENMMTAIKQHEDKGTSIGRVRTRFLDDFLLANIVNIRQVVLLGAGLDARAFRLELPSDLHFYEVDQDNVILYKNNILANDTPGCVRHCIATDLMELEWFNLLLEQGFQPEEPTFWILEGLMYYLTDERAKLLMSQINDLSAMGSYLGCDLINDAKCNDESEYLSTMWQFSCNEPEDFLAEYGWQAKVVQPSDKEAWFGRFTFQYPPREDKEGVHHFFVTAIKKN